MLTLSRASRLLLSNVVLASGERTDILIEDGRISEIGDGLSGGPVMDVIDGQGHLALPGAFDSHVHFNAPGGRSNWEGWSTGSAAAAAGGVTTVAEMPLNASPPTIDAATFAAKAAAAEAESWVDFALWGGVIPGNRGQLEELAQAGVLGFKAFMSTSGSDDFPAADDLTLYEAMATIAPLGLPLLLHAESDSMTAALAERARSAERTSVRDYLDSRPAVAETEAISRAIELAATTGCRLHIVHVSTVRGVQLVQAARERGQEVTCEITAHHLALDEEDAIALGAVAKCAPPLRPRAEVDALWPLLAEDPTLFVISDHSPSPPDLKLGDDAFAIWGGIAGIQSTAEVVLSDGCLGGRLPLAAAPRVLATAAADCFGLPAKGRLEVGADADIAIVALDDERVLSRDELLDRHRFSPYVGRPLHARVQTTLLRGQVIYHDGATVGAPAGRLLRPAAPA